MLERSVRVPMSNRPAGMATTMPAIQVAMAGVRYFGWTREKKRGEQAVARHREPDARLAELEDENRRDHAHECAEQNDEADQWRTGRRRMDSFLRVLTTGAASSIMLCQGTRPVRIDGDADVEDGADDEGGDDADGDVALRVAALFGGGGDGVEADVGEEDDGAAGEDAGPAVGREGVPVSGVDEVRRRSR